MDDDIQNKKRKRPTVCPELSLGLTERLSEQKEVDRRCAQAKDPAVMERFSANTLVILPAMVHTASTASLSLK